ncbi:hypothetical protein [Terrihabitans sp. B22-R8]|uniref:hypothetical protein n=1 Tax=Terrihabitans sp. B22-R8 TaxID=3425128 RepID=UPI00403D3D44
MRITRLLISSAAISALAVTSLPAIAMPAAPASAIGAPSSLIKVHDHHTGAVAGVALGAGLIAGAAIASSNRPREVYIEEAPPPPPRTRVYYERRETADQAVQACARGLLDTARREGAYDSEVGFIDSVIEKPDGGHRVEAEITLVYPRYEKTSTVVCHTEDGYLVSARTGY